jgi:fructosamine-3-kinase
MSIPRPVLEYIESNGFGQVVKSESIGGGCINNGSRLTTESGHSLFLKTNAFAPRDMFAAEALGLDALRVEDGPRIPEVYLHTPDAILLEDLRPVGRGAVYWENFGAQMAMLHSKTNDQFGFFQDNYIGSTPQVNQKENDGWEFFARHRLITQAELARRNGYFSKEDVSLVKKLCERLVDLVPEQPASIIHGDLWAGNMISDEQGAPALIDPATHYGWAEADLAMMTLFGSVPQSFYQAYEDVRPLTPGYQKRFPLYNLYHLINHVNLFGVGYYGQSMKILREFK